MTSERPTGYRGALPTRNDALAKPWVIAEIAIFVLIFVLAALGFPSKVFPRASAEPSRRFPCEGVPARCAGAAAELQLSGVGLSIGPDAVDGLTEQMAVETRTC